MEPRMSLASNEVISEPRLLEFSEQLFKSVPAGASLPDARASLCERRAVEPAPRGSESGALLGRRPRVSISPDGGRKRQSVNSPGPRSQSSRGSLPSPVFPDSAFGSSPRFAHRRQCLKKVGFVQELILAAEEEEQMLSDSSSSSGSSSPEFPATPVNRRVSARGSLSCTLPRKSNIYTHSSSLADVHAARASMLAGAAMEAASRGGAADGGKNAHDRGSVSRHDRSSLTRHDRSSVARSSVARHSGANDRDEGAGPDRARTELMTAEEKARAVAARIRAAGDEAVRCHASLLSLARARGARSGDKAERAHAMAARLRRKRRMAIANRVAAATENEGNALDTPRASILSNGRSSTSPPPARHRSSSTCVSLPSLTGATASASLVGGFALAPLSENRQFSIDETALEDHVPHYSAAVALPRLQQQQEAASDRGARFRSAARESHPGRGAAIMPPRRSVRANRLPEVPRLRNRFRDQRPILGGRWQEPTETRKRVLNRIADDLGLQESDWPQGRHAGDDFANLQIAVGRSRERKRYDAASTIQRFWRMRRHNRALVRFTLNVKTLITRLQHWMRHLVAWKLPVARRVLRKPALHAATTRIQASFRGFATRRRARVQRLVWSLQCLQHKLIGAEPSHIARLQACARGFLARQRARAERRARAELAAAAARAAAAAAARMEVRSPVFSSEELPACAPLQRRRNSVVAPHRPSFGALGGAIGGAGPPAQPEGQPGRPGGPGPGGTRAGSRLRRASLAVAISATPRREPLPIREAE